MSYKTFDVVIIYFSQSYCLLLIVSNTQYSSSQAFGDKLWMDLLSQASHLTAWVLANKYFRPRGKPI